MDSFDEKTYKIISYILGNECDVYETDAPGNDDFDAMAIATKLKELGDHYDETVIQPLMRDVQAAARDQVATAFANSVDALCNTWVAERADIAPEKQLLKATVTLALYINRNSPDMTRTVQDAMARFVNNRLASWIMQQGGWEQASFS